MTNKRFNGSVPRTMDAAVRRCVEMVFEAVGGTGRSWRRRAGGMSGSYYENWV